MRPSCALFGAQPYLSRNHAERKISPIINILEKNCEIEVNKCKVYRQKSKYTDVCLVFILHEKQKAARLTPGGFSGRRPAYFCLRRRAPTSASAPRPNSAKLPGSGTKVMSPLVARCR